MWITAPLYFSKCPPLAAMHFTALAFMSNIALLTISWPICATSHCSGDVELKLIEVGREWGVDLRLQEAPEAEVEGGEVGERGGHI